MYAHTTCMCIKQVAISGDSNCAAKNFMLRKKMHE